MRCVVESFIPDARGPRGDARLSRFHAVETNPHPLPAPQPSRQAGDPLPFTDLFSGSGCRAATTPPRAAAERLAPTACAAGRGATRRSATSSTTPNRYPFTKGEENLRWQRVRVTEQGSETGAFQLASPRS